eukprot:2361385-Pleurochrysis_carterae.AAC.1
MSLLLCSPRTFLLPFHGTYISNLLSLRLDHAVQRPARHLRARDKHGAVEAVLRFLYFISRNCLRKVRSAQQGSKPLMLVREASVKLLARQDP